jgi:RNA polymerase primary sigma factor
MAFELRSLEPLRELTTFREEGENDPSVTDREAKKVNQKDGLERDGNIAGIYLKEMNRVPLLTREKEIELAKRIRLGEWKMRILLMKCSAAVEEIDRLGPQLENGAIKPWDGARYKEEITSKVIRKLEELAKHSGDDGKRFRDLLADLKKTEADVKEAKSEMIQSNLRLVVRIAKNYSNRGLSFLDLLQEGNLGLMKAVTRYDYRKGFKFSTYASWWIKQAITRAVADKSRTIRIPNHILERKGKISKIFHRFVREWGREPLPEEIASEAGIDLTNVQKVMDLIEEPVSLETPVGEDGKLEDFIESEESLSLFDDLIKGMDQERKTRDLLSLLNSREAQILRLRFGIGEPTSYTLEEVGKRFGISRERVRQIEHKAIKKLQGQPRAREIYGGLLRDSLA